MGCSSKAKCSPEVFRKDHCGVFVGADYNLGTYIFGAAFEDFVAEVVFGVGSLILETLRSDVDALNWSGGTLNDLILPNSVMAEMLPYAVDGTYIIYLEHPDGAPKVPYAWGTLGLDPRLHTQL